MSVTVRQQRYRRLPVWERIQDGLPQLSRAGRVQQGQALLAVGEAVVIRSVSMREAHLQSAELVPDATPVQLHSLEMVENSSSA